MKMHLHDTDDAAEGNLVQELERRLLPLLRDMVSGLLADFPQVNTYVYSCPIGSLTSFQGHSLGIDCLLPDARPDEPDNVTLHIGLQHLDADAKMDVDVCWGHPHAYVEEELFPEPVPVTPTALDELLATLPRLYEALRTAVRRGCPPPD